MKHGNNAYAGSGATETYSEIPLGTVAFTSGSYTVPETNTTNFVYAVMGADNLQTGTAMKISVNASPTLA